MHFATLRYTLIIPAVFCLACSYTVFGQTGSNNTGNGGINAIRGRIYLPNGRTLDRSIKVELQSSTQPTQSVYTDSNGGFAFTGLNAGSYTVVVNAGDSFEEAREYFLIDQEVQLGSVRVTPIPKSLSAPIYLRPKRAEGLRNEVLNAKWSAIPRDAVQHFKRGLELLRDGKETEAESEFRNAIAAAPNFAPAYTALGSIEVKAGKFDKAVESLKLAVRYDAAEFEANQNLGIAYFNLNKMSEAEPLFVNAAYLNGYSVVPHYYLGLIFSVRNDADVAQKAFEKVRELDGGKTFPVIHKYLGRIYIHKQMNKAAVAEFEAYLSLLPTAKDADAVRKEISEIKTRPNQTKYAPA